MQILIVDDDELTLELLSNTLLTSGYEVITACNGKQALELLDSTNCRLVISDWEMPEMNGLELCCAIRSQRFSRYIYTILLTSHTSAQDIVDGLSAGADDFIGKPFNPAELIVRVRAGERVMSLETRDLAIFAMAKLAESRDPETGAHLERVRSFAKTLAQELHRQGSFQDAIDAQFCSLIYLTSPLHDIGKVAIPDCVLLKPGRLSDREFEIMKSHTLRGAETLEAALQEHPNARFLSMARDIAACHHERYDGTGYPRGLVGDDIPLAARVVSVADVYDALTTKRVYKAAFAHDVARSIITEESGKQFDPRVVDGFLAVEEAFIEIRDRYSRADVLAYETA